MTLAEDRTEQYIRFHLSDFFRIDVLEILSHLPCLTVADQDEIRAYHERHGNRHSVWKLFDHLRRRSGWVTFLITALRECELTELSDAIAREYDANQAPGSLNRPRVYPAPVSPGVQDRDQQVPLNSPRLPSAGAPRPPPPLKGKPSDGAASSLPDTTYNGYPEDPESEEARESYRNPVQDTQTPDSKREVPGVALNPASGDVSKNSPSSPGHSSFSAPVPEVTGQHNKSRGGSGDRPPASPRGPVSPSVSFVPRSAPASGPPLSPSPMEASSPRATASFPENGNQRPAALSKQTSGLPASREPTPKSTGSQKVPSSTPKFPSSPHPARSPQRPPGPVPAGQAPSVEEVDLSKPGVLLSFENQPYSGGSERLLLSGSSGSGSMGSLHISATTGNSPEENDYVSVTDVPFPGKPEATGPPSQAGGSESSSSLGTFELFVDERPCSDLVGSPGPGQTPSVAEQHGLAPSREGSWGMWVGSAVAVALFSVALAVMYKRLQK